MFFPQQWLFRNICHGIFLVPPVWISQAPINLCFSHFRDVYKSIIHNLPGFFYFFHIKGLPFHEGESDHTHKTLMVAEKFEGQKKIGKVKKKKGRCIDVLLSVEPRFKIDSVGFCTDHHFAGRKWLENTYISFGTLK